MERKVKSRKSIIVVASTLVLLIGISISASATTYYSQGSVTPSTLTNWNTNISGGGLSPANFTTDGDVYIIQSGHTMIPTSNWTVSGTVTINSGGTFAVTSTGKTTINGSFIINSGGIATINRPLIVTGTTTISGTINFGSRSYRARLMTFNGDVTLNSTAIWNEPATGNGADNTYTFAGNFVNNALSFNAMGTGIHTFSGASKTLSGSTITSIGSITVSGTPTNTGTVTVRTALEGSGNLTNGTSGTLNIGGTIAITTLTTTAANNLVNYTGAAQTAKVTTYNNLTLSGSGAKTFASNPTVNGVLSLEGAASVIVTSGVVTYGTGATLQYNKPASYTSTTEEWITPFVAAGGIIIKNTGAITTPGAVQIGNNTNVPLNINSGATLTPGANLITLHGGFINAGTLTSGSGGVTIAGTVTSQAIDGFTTTGTVTLTKTTGTATLDGNVNGGPLTINGSGGTLNLGVGLTHTFSGIVTLTAGTLNGGSNTLNVTAVSGSAWNGTGSVFNAGTGTVNFSGAGAQTLSASATTFNNLTLSNSGLKTFSTTPTVNGVLSMQGTATVSAAPTYGSGATLQYNTSTSRTAGPAWISPFVARGGVEIGNTGTISMDAAKVFNSTAPMTIQSGSSLAMSTFLLTLNGNLVNNGGTTTGSGGVSITGTATQSIGSFTTTGLVSMTKSGGTATLTGNVNGAGLTINGSGGTLDLGIALTHTFTGNVTLTSGSLNGGTSTLNENNVSTTAWNGSGSVFTANAGTVNFGASGNQTIAANSSFYDLAFLGSGNKTLSNATTIIKNLTISGSAKADLGILTHGSNSLTLGGSLEAVGSWGSTGSTATNKNNTYFLSTSSGILNVACTAPSPPVSSGNQTICSGQTIPQLSVTVGGGEFVDWYTLASGGIKLATSSLTYTPGTGGTYYAETRASGGCLSATRTGVTLTINDVPTVLSLTGSAICTSPGTNGTIASTTSESGVNYQLYDLSNAVVQSAKAGNGSALTWTGLSAGNGYYVKGTNATTSCNSISGTVNVTTYSNPAALTLTGSTICANPGGNGTISSTTSVAGINYQLYNSGNAAVQSAQPGTGAGLLWSNLSAGTGYYVTGTSATTSCASSNSNAVNVTAFPNPVALVLTGSTICASPGGNGTISSSTSQPGVDYQLFDNTDNEVQTPIAGTGSGLTWSGLPAGTGYYAIATDATYDCVSSNSNAVDITTTSNPVVSNFSASAATACGGNGTLVTVRSTTLASGTYTVAYSVSGSNTVTSTTASMSFTAGTPGTGTFTTANLITAGSANVVHITSVTLASAGCSSNLSTNTSAFTTSSSGAWIGGASGHTTDWFTAANWCGGTIPTSFTNIVLTSGLTYYPDITASGAVCNNITIGTGTSLTITGSNILTVSGNWTISGGTFNANSSTVNFAGSSAQTIVSPSGSTPCYHDLILSGSGTLTLPGSAIQILGDLSLSGSVTVTPTAYPVSVSGITTIGGTSNLILGSAEVLSDAGPVIMNGGTFTTGSATGYSEKVGALQLTYNSYVVLGSGSHTLTFAASNLVTWENGKTLTIKGWTGTLGASGTGGKIFMGTSGSGLTAAQLAQIKFNILSVNYEASILPTGEIVPAVENTWSWNGSSDRTWANPANWSSIAGDAPGDGSNVIIYSGVNQPLITGNIACNDLTITSGVLTISNKGRLAVNGTLTNSIGATGLLIQSSSTGEGMLLNSTSSVPATVELYLTGGGGNSFHFIVPPVTSFNIGSTVAGVGSSLNTQYFNGDLMNYSELRAGTNQNSGWSYFDGYTTSALGYAIDPFSSLNSDRGYNIYLTSSDKITFTGLLNSTPHTTFNLNRSPGCVGWNLIGNPYPCYYDMTGISELNNADNGIDKAVYFYHNGVYEYRNISLGAGTGNYSSTNVVPPMQGFFVHVSTSRSETISLPSNNGSTYYKTLAGSASRSKKSANLIEASPVQKVKLVLSNSAQSDEAIVCLIDNATTGFDSDFDGYKLFGSNISVPFIYTSLNSVKYAINSLKGPVSEPVAVPVTVEIKSPGNYTIDATEFENLDGIDVVLKHGPIETKLSKNTSYSFTSAAGIFTDFQLIFGKSVTGVENPKPVAEKFKTWYSSNFLYIICPPDITATNASLVVYDMQGKPVYDNRQVYLIPGQTIQLPLTLSKGVYVTRITVNNHAFASKIVII